MEKIKVEKKRVAMSYGAMEKCKAVLSVWTERRRPGEICRELSIPWMAYGGLFVIIGMFLSFTYAKPAFFSRLIDEYVPFISATSFLSSLYFLYGISFLIFIIHIYSEEKKGKYQSNSRDDLIRILKPNTSNILFWSLILLLNIIAFVYGLS